MIIVVFGLPGTGKSYFASQLADRLMAAYLSTDEIRKQIIPDPEYTPEEKLRVYEEVVDQMLTISPHYAYSVIDGTFFLASLRKLIRNEAKRAGFKVTFIEVTADEELVRQRLRKSRENSDADFTVYQRIKDSFEPFREEHLILRSSDENLADMINEALIFIKPGFS